MSYRQQNNERLVQNQSVNEELSWSSYRMNGGDWKGYIDLLHDNRRLSSKLQEKYFGRVEYQYP
jgi:hypothetical protein